MLAAQVTQRPLGVDFLGLAAEEPAPSLPEAMETARRLTALLDEEIRLLRSLDIAELRELSEEKVRLAAAWSSQAARLQADRGFVEALEPRLRDEFLQVTEALQQTVRINASALRGALDAHDRLFRAIAAAAQEQRGRQAPAGYAASGQRPAPRPMAAVGVAFDRSL